MRLISSATWYKQAIVALLIINPIVSLILSMDRDLQPIMFFIANDVLSMISDNVFVATVYINEVADAPKQGVVGREHFNVLAIAINTGTNLPGVATPNGQAAFLFLLAMLWMALPYTIVLSAVGMIAIYTLFEVAPHIATDITADTRPSESPIDLR